MQVLAIFNYRATLNDIDKVARDCDLYKVYYQANSSQTVVGTDSHTIDIKTNLNDFWMDGEPNNTHNVEVNLELLDVCNCDFFLGYSGDTLAVPYFPSATVENVKEAIFEACDCIMWINHPLLSLNDVESVALKITSEFNDLEHELGDDDNVVYAYLALTV